MQATVARYRKRFLVCLLLWVPIMILMYIIPYAAPVFMVIVPVVNGIPLYVFLFAISATVIQFFAGLVFYKGAYKSVRNGSFNMDVLVTLGTSCAWGYGIILMIMGLPCKKNMEMDMQIMNCEMASMHTVHNFEMSSSLITIILLGKLLEAVSKRKTVEKLEQLSSLTITEAILLDQNEEKYLSKAKKPKEEKVSVDLL